MLESNTCSSKAVRPSRSLFLMLSLSCVAVIFSFTGRATSAEPTDMDKMVGNWVGTPRRGEENVYEFRKDGTFKLSWKTGTGGDGTEEGTYKVAGEGIVELTSKGLDGKDKTDKVKYKFGTGSLVLTWPVGQPIKFTKQK
jgi:uncharacterized protein (TIGR03066 family)